LFHVAAAHASRKQLRGSGHDAKSFTFFTQRRHAMKWSKPQYQDLRFGFEITMYISNR